MENKREEELQGMTFDPNNFDTMRNLCLSNCENSENFENKKTKFQSNEDEDLFEQIQENFRKDNYPNEMPLMYENGKFLCFGEESNSKSEEEMDNQTESNNEIDFNAQSSPKMNKGSKEFTIQIEEKENDLNEKPKEKKTISYDEDEDISNENLTQLENQNLEQESQKSQGLKIEIETLEKKIFTIRKNKKKLLRKMVKDKNRIQKQQGRKFKNSTANRLHDKFSQDNIIRKFKTHLINNFRLFINKTLIDHSKEIVLINGYQCQNNEIEFNLNWLKTKLKDVFSAPVSTKVNKKNLCDNKKTIEEIFKEKKEEGVIRILNKTVEEAMNDYIGIGGKNMDSCYYGLKKLKDDVEEMRSKGESEDYAKKYIFVATNFEKIYRNKVPRCRKNACK